MASTTLRAVTHRLTTTPVEQLPSIASFLATSLNDCAELLSAPQNQKPGKTDSDNAVQIHKLKTRLASLLQDRSVEGRWTAVVLVKATVEAGQWEILRGYEPIVRSLIGILAKPDPISTRKMCIITLTRIFHLTYQYPTLVREITTPHLPGFVTAALNLVSTLAKLPSGSSRKPKPNSPFMEIVLHAILELIPRHPTIFRPFGSQLRSLLTEILGVAPPMFYPEPVVDVAEQLFASLYKCAPKDKSGSGWSDDCRSTILSLHRAVDHVFRAVVEQWESVDASLIPTRISYTKEVGDGSADHLGLPRWEGIHNGTDRILSLLRILAGFISMPSASGIAIPLGSILDLTSRLTSVVVPANGEASGARANPQIGREEREQLWTELPRIHIAVMELLAQVVGVLENSTTSITQSILDQATWVFRNEKFSKDVRLATYGLLQPLVSLNGPAMTKQTMASISNVLRSCCHDILPLSGDSVSQFKPQADSKSKSKAGPGTTNADSFLNPNLQNNRQSPESSNYPGGAASGLLRAALSSVPSELLTASVRAEIDRAIILTADKDAMLASVLNPIPAFKGRGAGASIVPFLARSYSDQMEIEALIRPRMPVLMTVPELDTYAANEEGEADEAEEIAEEAYNTVPATAGFLKAPEAEPQQPEPTPAAPSVHKRTYAEESTLQSSGFASIPEQKPTQTKKARFEDSASATASQPPVTVTQMTSSSTLPVHYEASSAPKQPQFETQVSTVSTSSQPTAQLSVDDSDDELPTLNMDPDTEDEDDDDITMEG
ncbi:hypothetical protein N7532_006788 [Penicillium argentinense]|uniref:Pre-rRNA-processing protein RIX1 n=1 Tax=Penicillium argentinense TaxID=1131581 RepID=A0A9W9FGX7_9EURO|nr:uncharacterized protein N7532_006788 [Penicillium argentinense]KAJ5099787.1 hypothetical protein N7532_006788 [Penicillium argentinense]